MIPSLNQAKAHLHSKYYIPTHAPDMFYSQLYAKTKLGIPLGTIRKMDEDIVTSHFVNSTKIYEALCTDVHWRKYLPDYFCEGMRSWILEVLNTFTGGEFEQTLWKINVELKKLQREITEENKKVKLLFFSDPTDRELAARLEYQMSLEPLSTKKSKKQQKLPGLTKNANSNLFRFSSHAKLNKITSDWQQDQIMSLLEEVFPVTRQKVAYGKMQEVLYGDIGLSCKIDIYIKVTTIPKGDPLEAPYLAWLDPAIQAQQAFIQRHSHVITDTIKKGTVRFYLSCDPQVEAVPSFRFGAADLLMVATNELTEEIVKPLHDFKRMLDKAREKYVADLRQRVAEREILETHQQNLLHRAADPLIMFLALRDQTKLPDSIHPSDIPADGHHLSCPVCYTVYQNIGYYIFQCKHVLCYNCMQMLQQPVCPLCKTPITGLLQEGSQYGLKPPIESLSDTTMFEAFNLPNLPAEEPGRVVRQIHSSSLSSQAEEVKEHEASR